MKVRPGRLLLPALRWDTRQGYEAESAAIEAALRLGVGGFSIFGGTADAVADLTWRIQSRSDVPLLFGSDLERGAGQQFAGATPLPPLAAIGALEDAAATRRAGELTAREALALGINWLYAPDADVDLEPRNPIIGTRAFGTDPSVVAGQVVAWIEGAHAAGALACVKHFPGHGRTTEDSHATLPSVTAGRAELDLDLEPFRAAVRAGVDSVMTAHVVYPALDPAGTAATLSAPILQQLLRGELGFNGLIVTDALIMQGILAAGGGDEAAASIAAVRAGCDAILYPKDLATVGAAFEAAFRGALTEARVTEAVERLEHAALARPPRWGYRAREEDRSWALEIAERAVRRVRGRPSCPPDFELLTIDDDVGGPFPAPARDAFTASLHAHGLAHRPVESTDGARPLLIALYADIRAWKGQPGLSATAASALRSALAVRGDATVLLFGHPRLAEDLPGENVLAAWGGEAIMQQAAAGWLRAHATRTVL
ncbi:MAG TPA: glycoside hydrolase family 3 N-terminal domain-containing protein [Longimicrobiales bacterium]|nr:glycoside hydrolase family 3 N-terminal domain-containing protein [Longimicrobiales bacterium]